MRSKNLVNEEAFVHWGLSHQKQTKNQICAIKYAVFLFLPSSFFQIPCSVTYSPVILKSAWDNTQFLGIAFLLKTHRDFVLSVLISFSYFAIAFCLLTVHSCFRNRIEIPSEDQSLLSLQQKEFLFYVLIGKVHFQFPGNTRLEFNEIRSSFNRHWTGNHLRSYGATVLPAVSLLVKWFCSLKLTLSIFWNLICSWH